MTHELKNELKMVIWWCLGLHSHPDAGGKGVSVMPGVFNETTHVYNIAAIFDQMYRFLL